MFVALLTRMLRVYRRAVSDSDSIWCSKSCFHKAVINERGVRFVYPTMVFIVVRMTRASLQFADDRELYLSP